MGEVHVSARPWKSIQNKWGLTLRRTSTILCTCKSSNSFILAHETCKLSLSSCYVCQPHECASFQIRLNISYLTRVHNPKLWAIYRARKHAVKWWLRLHSSTRFVHFIDDVPPGGKLPKVQGDGACILSPWFLEKCRGSDVLRMLRVHINQNII